MHYSICIFNFILVAYTNRPTGGNNNKISVHLIKLTNTMRPYKCHQFLRGRPTQFIAGFTKLFGNSCLHLRQDSINLFHRYMVKKTSTQKCRSILQVKKTSRSAIYYEMYVIFTVKSQELQDRLRPMCKLHGGLRFVVFSLPHT